ncbi:MAG: hypothetical protein M1548_10390 [Actinobacteria bacterium]|nr:hypothetical protein [Actinomycetota bacterium]
MKLASGIEVVNLLLSLTAGLVAVGILRRVSGRLATSWRFLLIAFLVLAFAELFGAIEGSLGIFGISKVLAVSLLFQSGHLVFIVLAFIGLWYQFGLLKKLTGREDE